VNVVPVPVVLFQLVLHQLLGRVTVLDSQELFLIVTSIDTVSVVVKVAGQSNCNLVTLSVDRYHNIGYSTVSSPFTSNTFSGNKTFSAVYVIALFLCIG
jgi:hypothetical protein